MSPGSSRLSAHDLFQALERRDGALLSAHSRRWAHRHGVEALESLIQFQGLDQTARLWWREQLLRPTPAVATAASGALHEFQPAVAATVSPVSEPLSTASILEDSVPLPPEWLVPAGVDQPPEVLSESGQELAKVAGNSTDLQPEASEAPQVFERPEAKRLDVAVAVVDPEDIDPVAFEAAVLEPAVAFATEPLPPLAEAFGPIPGLEPLPSFNVQAIFAMQSELAERPLAPPIVPPVIAPPAELQLDAFAAVEAPAEAVAPAVASGPEPFPAVPMAVEARAAQPAAQKPSGPRRNPFSRLRGLLKDCVEEVASTFGNNEDDEAYSSMEPVSAAAEAPPLNKPLVEPPAAQPAAPQGAIAPPPFALQQPLQPTRQAQRRGRIETGSGAGRAGRANQPGPATPAPAPSHPALDSLRSWLPDGLEQDDHRQAS
ncbi:hypothetical protein [Synechococcus sp. RedBA-s]|uniref:hypothetical protein n=1 Tax=Synechococcus sp. RedBA-s TaxID=2823741 RepID=UPI0020CF5A92|nr:hypothetical protein [Synechococcus sp. RedBA-s]MCP9801476.1 hypothetical protein [Synechococcus sp. RedBA-s]